MSNTETQSVDTIYPYKDFDGFKLDMLSLVQEYHKLLETDAHNAEAIQNIRDQLSEALVLTSNLYANMKNAVTSAEYNRKKCERQRAMDIRNDMRNDKGAYARGSATLAADQAFLDCDGAYQTELDAVHNYEEARQLIESINQHLNSISSRLRFLIKYEQQ